MYCPECGHKIDDPGVRFCPECGTEITADTRQEEPAEEKRLRTDRIAGNGIILTNSYALARKFGCTEKAVCNLIEQFISIKRRFGVEYVLADAGNYTFRPRGFFGRQRTVKLDAFSPIDQYMEILRDMRDRLGLDGNTSVFLFIIGSEDVIPMPRIKNYIQKSSDSDIDTDMVLSYPYGKEVPGKLERQEAFRMEQLFNIGRLPLGLDSTFEDLAGYLDRDLENSGGIKSGSAYGQSDPNWKNISFNVASELTGRGMLRNLDGLLPKECHYKGLILSPMITCDTVEHVLHKSASLYYFNLHGGSGTELRGYFGALTPEDGGEMYPVILPEHLAECTFPNIVVSEACYGGKFIGLDRYHSMVQSALFSGTLIFLGSSRTAWGAVDSRDGQELTGIPLHNADMMASAFIRSFLSGKTAGEALFDARRDVLAASDRCDPYAALTVTEFNLFGDPSLSVSISCAHQNKSCSKILEKDSTGPEVSGIEEVGVPGSESPAGILAMVRNAVDENIRQIRTMVETYLYSQYNIKPGEPENIFRVKYNDGKEELMFKYITRTSMPGIQRQYNVSVSKEGKVNRVITTR